MPLFGLHVSSAGSWVLTFERAKELNAEVFQFFLRSPRSWKIKEYTPEILHQFIEKRKNWKGPLMVHAPYLINLATDKEDLLETSVRVVAEELALCDQLLIDYYVLHPGTAHGDVREAVRKVVSSLEKILSIYEPKHTMLLIENTAGERGDIGKSVEELALLTEPFPHDKVGVCIDTCHAFAYGYAINTAEGFELFKLSLDGKVGIQRVKAIHCNDSKVPLGARKDRHQHIGYGYIGRDGFANFLRDEYFSQLPYYLETPKEGDWDTKNLNTLKELYSEVTS
ncbi:apurinic endonuclease Apn1 [Thermocrinis albus DSM 14484]|uniref:Probable endonuclease 4 n=1 Tax=Thermocrinis albus (strain DSM 14484 / JCM 11386 / HI 11/12) TaxID=638303 RepID=D3SP88_THEAH|nr:deoxyribonuclease IV [Thermocrinis albus]ADC88975.1 apurinic endonuclease Apn1 [Thermocrinis albus DSM 14484]